MEVLRESGMGDGGEEEEVTVFDQAMGVDGWW